MQVLIKPKCLNSRIWIKASIAAVISVASEPNTSVAPEPDIPVIDRILVLNRMAPSLDPLRERANKENSLYKLEDGILTYKRRLVMLVWEEGILVAELLYEIYE
jgi:hypothetical protein